MEAFKKQFNEYYWQYLLAKQQEIKKIDKQADEFYKQILLLAKSGKRLRPYFCYLGYSGFGGKDKKLIMNSAMALEVLHLFALVHDDIMDKAKTRRGLDTVQNFIFKKTHDKHFSLSVALLAGDLIFSFSQDLIAQNIYWQKLKQELMVGQYLDIKTTIKKNLEEKGILRIMELKTASYTVLRPLQIGAYLAGAAKTDIEKLADFALPAGVAFQIQDDIQGIDELNELNLARLKGMDYCQKLSQDLITKAKKSLLNVKINKSVKKVLCQTADYLIARKN